ncbi:MAG: sugar phosphate isomerase/epimerase [Phycisphaeraceae bacterium]
MNSTRLAINTITLNQAPFDEQVAAVAAAGFANIELYLPAVKTWLTDHHRTPADARALLDHHHLTCIGGFEAPVNAFGDDDARARNHTLHRQNADLLATLGGDTALVIGADGPAKDSDLRAEDALHHLGEQLAHLADTLAPTVRLALEFNWSPLARSLRSALVVVRAADHPRVGWLFDPAHYHCTSTKPDDITPEAVATLFHVHVDNMRDRPGEHSNCNGDRVLPGDPRGILDLDDLIARIEAAGYTGDYSIEMFDKDLWALPAPDAARRAYEAMTTL